MHTDIHITNRKLHGSDHRKYFLGSQLVRNQCFQIAAGGTQIFLCDRQVDL